MSEHTSGELACCVSSIGPTCRHKTTPVADALTRVNQIQADNTNIAAWVQKDRELAALRKLAGAVRSHGIGAELGQLREQRQLADALAQGEVALAGDPNVSDLDALARLVDAARAALLRPRYEHAHCTGCGAWYLAGHGPGCGVGAAEADEAAVAVEAEQAARVAYPPVPGVTQVDGHTVIAVLPGVRDLAWYVACELPGSGLEAMWSAGHMFVSGPAGQLTYEPSGLYARKSRALQVLAELAGIAPPQG